MKVASLRSKFVGCMVGCAVGDAFGASFHLSKKAKLIFRGKWTDDTHMMLGVAESIIACKGLNEEHMIWSFIRNWKKEPWRGYGPGPQRIFRMIISGVSWKKVAGTLYGGTGSFGNGAAMRVAPIGLFYYDNVEELRRVACKSAMLTHTHPLGIEGAVIQAYAVATALKTRREDLDPKDFLENIENFTVENIYRKKLRLGRSLLEENDRKVIIRALGNSVESFNSVPTAIYSFAKNIESYIKAVIFAANLGGDTDTICAMTGAISGAHHGENGILKAWSQKLEKIEYITRLAEKLWKLKFDIQNANI